MASGRSSPSIPTGGARQVTTGTRWKGLPSVSAGGRQIAYMYWELALQDYKLRLSTIRVVNVDGTGNHAVTTGKLGDYGPEWLPDGQHIMFSCGSSVRPDTPTSSPRSGR